MNLEELEVYKIAMEIGDEIYMMVDGWNFFQRDTMENKLFDQQIL